MIRGGQLVNQTSNASNPTLIAPQTVPIQKAASSLANKRAYFVVPIILFGFLFLEGCHWGAYARGADGQIRAHQACEQECNGKRAKQCMPLDKECMKELGNCVRECERYYGYRSSGPAGQ